MLKFYNFYNCKEKAISFSQLGNYGRFGNQLFQVACGLSLAEKQKCDFLIPLRDSTENIQHVFSPLKQIRYIDEELMEHGWAHYIYEEPRYQFTPINLTDEDVIRTPYNTLGKGPTYYDLKGYFQSEKYFLNIKDLLIKTISREGPKKRFAGMEHFYLNYNWRSSVSATHHSYTEDVKNMVKCAVHIRRTDYVDNAFYHNLSFDYYTAAMDKVVKEVGSHVMFVVYSDDIDWCRNFFEQNSISKYNVIFRSNWYSLMNDFFSMIHDCEHIICANSSFSWWASYVMKGIKEDALVIMPDKWFGPQAINTHNHQDIYYEGCSIIVS